MSSPQNAPKYSVLILGSTQAGKSTLIEHIRSYNDPGYAIDKSLLGDGITSKTDTTTPFLIESNLPTYEAYWKDTGVALELNNFATQYQDEEDYRDAILSHSDDVGMRLVPQDTTAPSVSMEFRLLDTPGFNGTEDRHSEHATSIVNEVISTRSFNLIVFVISAKVPLTEEKQLALEYFAYVLRGLHSRIVFLYTHVDYADTHHSNTTYHLDMLTRSKTISRIFRRHDGESVFDEFNIKEYPCLNIDLTTRNRPIVQCMIRNTIREILTMATAPPAILDTSTSNIERIRTATYPTEVGQEQRKNLKATLQRKLAKPKYSVLIMGKTQAGKSTLIEHIKNYANRDYAIDWSLLGNGKLSETESTRPFYVESNLPAYEVYRKDTGEVIDLDNLPSKFDDEEDYRDILFSRERDVGLRLAPQDPNNPSDNIEFRLWDSLGLKNADENDSNDTAMIIDKLIHIQTFNLIIITESYKNLLTQEQQLALEYYANVFKGLHSRIMFLHTHVAYTDMHPTNRTHHLNMRMKNKALSKLFRRYDNEVPFDGDNFEEYPSLTIDLVSKKRPVITCMIRNTIREILKMATRPAVLFDTSIQHIERIRAIPYPTQFTNEQLKQAKVRLQEDAHNFEEVQAEVQAEKPVEESPSGNNSIVPPIVSGPHPHLPGIIGSVSGGAIIGSAIASHKKKDKETQQETVVTEVLVETDSTKPTVSKGSSWFKKPIGAVAVAGGAVVAGAGAVKSGAHHVSSGVQQVASGSGSAAVGALEKVDGVWKRTVKVVTTRKAHVDKVAPIAETSYVYYDEEVYDSVLTEKSTGITYVTQLLFDTKIQKYYVYVRWGESDYKLDGPRDTIESAKSAFQVTYKERFGLEWETRETTVSEEWTYEVKTYETYEEVEYVEEIVEEEEAQIIIKQEKEIIVSEDVVVSEETTTTTTTEEVSVEHVTETTEVVMEEEDRKEKVTEIVIETGKTNETAAPKSSSWFKKACPPGCIRCWLCSRWCP
ncbi:MAG: hypothetical protein BYD32DRAFT_284076 [Podila humilis]|nr:MAG: hypothetical protein BYD32DRAFT_284076 [Podila humilis]